MRPVTIPKTGTPITRVARRGSAIIALITSPAAPKKPVINPVTMVQIVVSVQQHSFQKNKIFPFGMGAGLGLEPRAEEHKTPMLAIYKTPP